MVIDAARAWRFSDIDIVDIDEMPSLFESQARPAFALLRGRWTSMLAACGADMTEFEVFRFNNGQWMAPCLACYVYGRKDERNMMSIEVDEDDERMLHIQCGSDCRQADILRALQLTRSQLYPWTSVDRVGLD
ncbi:MAG: hypothetical protein JWN99_3014, partial [Ilumatobacteraceae bacterium]|nr:hypothetical protein [Ilumatobacteraceae bacterium]